MVIATLPLARLSASWRWSRDRNISCAANFRRHSSPLVFRKEGPGGGAGAGAARIEDADLAFKFRQEQIVVGARLFGLHQRRVMPDVFRLVDLKGVDIFLGVVEPDMAAEPALGIFDFGQNQQRLGRLENSGIEQVERCRRAADQ